MSAHKTILLIILCGFKMAQAQEWKHYPYHEEGSHIHFPRDEGRHNDCQVEWWYTTIHLTGDSTFTPYSVMLTYFRHRGSLGFRIFNIANETTDEFFSDVSPYYNETISEECLHIECTTLHGREKWVTKRDNDTLLPFQYHLEAASPDGRINLDFDAVKRPLMVGGDGFLPQGDSGETYYYAQTLLEVTGTLTLSDSTEPVTGTAWIDKQYFPTYLGSDEDYEWFCLQLSNGMDFNVWNIFTGDNRIPSSEKFGLASVYVNDDSQFVSSDFQLRRTQFWDAGGGIHYSHEWEFDLGDVHLTITPVMDDQEIDLPFRFYEGSCKVEGVVGKDSVTGAAFAELLHHYEVPRVTITDPPYGNTLIDSVQVVAWSLLNPDDGNPLFYSLSYSLGLGKFLPIASGIKDTSYTWDISELAVSNDYRLQLTGYSPDSTLVGVDISEFSIAMIEKHDTEPANRFRLCSNYPNPFTAITTIQYWLPAKGNSSLKVYDLTGRLVKTLVRGEIEAGLHKTQWNATDERGNEMIRGIYFCQLSVPDGQDDSQTATKALVLWR